MGVGLGLVSASFSCTLIRWWTQSSRRFFRSEACRRTLMANRVWGLLEALWGANWYEPEFFLGRGPTPCGGGCFGK